MKRRPPSSPTPRGRDRLLAWVNVELMKNVAEIADVVRLHAATQQFRQR